jgi:putative restriction endonuclease
MPKIKVDQIERASRAWYILVECAQNKQSITYGQLADKMGIHPRICRFFLGLIQDHCKPNNLPSLQSLVVNKRTRIPGDGYIASTRDLPSIQKTQNKVFNYAWNRIVNPF